MSLNIYQSNKIHKCYNHKSHSEMCAFTKLTKTLSLLLSKREGSSFRGRARKLEHLSKNYDLLSVGDFIKSHLRISDRT